MPIEIDGEQRYSYEEVSKLLGVARATLCQNASRHNIGLRLGKSRFFNNTDIELFSNIKKRGPGNPNFKKKKQ